MKRKDVFRLGQATAWGNEENANEISSAKIGKAGKIMESPLGSAILAKSRPVENKSFRRIGKVGGSWLSRDLIEYRSHFGSRYLSG